MNHSESSAPRIVIACGGTGGHLFPGMAVGERLVERGVEVTLVVSSKEVDRRSLGGDHPFTVLTLPAVGFSWARAGVFGRTVWRSYRLARSDFRARPPVAVLSMGGFTGAAPVVAAWRMGCPVFLHEGNAIPGRAHRWLARFARRVYVYFPEAERGFPGREVRVVGMPVRREFGTADRWSSRMALGLDPERPVLLVTGGSQGASGVNRALLAALPRLATALPRVQYLHLSGSQDEEEVRQAYRAAGCRAVVRAFLTEMDFALGAADAVVARAGASSTAEIAAVGVPALLIPYPLATDRHQDANAEALQRGGAAVVLSQDEADPERLVPLLERLMLEEEFRRGLTEGLRAWHQPEADAALAEDLLQAVGIGGGSGEGAAAPMREGEGVVSR